MNEAQKIRSRHIAAYGVAARFMLLRRRSLKTVHAIGPLANMIALRWIKREKAKGPTQLSLAL